MRLLLEIILAVAIIAIAWEKPLSDRASELPWMGDKVTPVAKTPQRPRSSTPSPRSVVTPAPTVSGAWMWDPNRKSPLDPPSKKHAAATVTPH